MKPFPIKYRWRAGRKWKTGQSVAEGKTIAEASARFFARNRHVQPIPAK